MDHIVCYSLVSYVAKGKERMHFQREEEKNNRKM